MTKLTLDDCVLTSIGNKVTLALNGTSVLIQPTEKHWAVTQDYLWGDNKPTLEQAINCALERLRSL